MQLRIFYKCVYGAGSGGAWRLFVLHVYLLLFDSEIGVFINRDKIKIKIV